LPTIQEGLNEVDDYEENYVYTKKRTFVSGSNNGAFMSNDLDVFDIEYKSEKEDSKVQKESAFVGADSSAISQSHEAVQDDAFLNRLHKKQLLSEKVQQQHQQPLPDLRDGLLLYFAAASLLLAGFCMQSSSINNEKSAVNAVNVHSGRVGGVMSASNSSEFCRVCSDEDEAEASSIAVSSATAQSISNNKDGDNNDGGDVEQAASNASTAAASVLRGACAGLGSSLFFLMWATESAVEGEGFAAEWASGAFAAAAAVHACGLRASLSSLHRPGMEVSAAAHARRPEGQAAAEWEASRQHFLSRIYKGCVLPAHAAVAAWHLAALWHLQRSGAATQGAVLYCLCAAPLWLISGGAAMYVTSRWWVKEELSPPKTPMRPLSAI